MVTKDDFEADAKKGSPVPGEPAQKKSKAKKNTEPGDKAHEVDEAGAKSAAPSDAEGVVLEGIEAEIEEVNALADALAEANEMRDRYLRLKAEWDNYRKRTEVERADERSRATQRLVEKLLPVLDDLERAIEHSDSKEEASLKEGIVQVYNKLQSVLEGEGVSVIDPKGEPFDANLHCAVSKAEDNKVPDETVLEVFQKGYAMGSRVLRPASVVVNSR